MASVISNETLTTVGLLLAIFGLPMMGFQVRKHRKLLLVCAWLGWALGAALVWDGYIIAHIMGSPVEPYVTYGVWTGLVGFLSFICWSLAVEDFDI